ncbi:MAG: hypothetical protein H8D45_00920 [Bacteroidetes bacterium]|nr:hypothetical protein [Bacteroidota bacterium]
MLNIDKYKNISTGKNELPVGHIDNFGNVKINNTFTNIHLDSFGNFKNGNQLTSLRLNEFGTIVNSNGLPASKDDFLKI